MGREGAKDSVKTGMEADFLPEPSPDPVLSALEHGVQGVAHDILRVPFNQRPGPHIARTHQ
jgi:hypothetical protein